MKQSKDQELFERGMTMYKEGVCYSLIKDSRVLRGYTFEERNSRCGMYYSDLFEHSNVKGSDLYKGMKKRGVL